MPVSRSGRQWPSPWLARLLRRIAIVGGGIAAVIIVLLVIHRGLLPLLAVAFPALETPFYDFAVYGAYRTQSYITFDLDTPDASVVQWDESCNDGLVLVSPNGPSVAKPGPMILNARGIPIWMTDEFDVVMNLQMQYWHGAPYLTFWAGTKRGSMGEGAMFMLDSNYEVAHKVHAVGDGLMGDLHEFSITDEGTALITIYNKTNFDLRPMGWGRPANGWIMDSMFQEINMTSGELLFEWRASDHFMPETSFYTHPFGGYVESIPFDFYHINSIEKDSKGNYLICSRHLHTITYIHGKTGETLWVLGGDSRDFEDLSGGLASDFKWQHHARWISEDNGVLSVFDNGAAGPLHQDSPYSRGTILRLDTENMTATHVQSFVSLQHTRASSQGSVQLLDNENVFVGWGSSAAYSEFAKDGRLLCEVHLAASWLFWWERVKSYRAYKVYGWVGQPRSPPTAKVEGLSVYVSWNGATEVRFWELQGCESALESPGEQWDSLELLAKHGFEEHFDLQSASVYARYRLAALDANNRVLSYSNDVWPDPYGSMEWSGMALGVCAAIGSAFGVWYVFKVWMGRQRRGQGQDNGVPHSFELGSARRFFRRDAYRYSKL